MIDRMSVVATVGDTAIADITVNTEWLSISINGISAQYPLTYAGKSTWQARQDTVKALREAVSKL